MTSWHLNANTFHVPTRMRHADEAADRYNEFRRNGYQVFASLPQDGVAALRKRIVELPTIKEGSLEHFETEAILKFPEFKAIATSPNALSVAAMWLGANPTILDVSAWRSTSNTNPEGAQQWHRDMDDWRACKLFVYLTDVTPENGPHQFVAGSHRPSFFEDRGLAPDRYFVGSARDVRLIDEIERFPRVEFCGPAGTCWMENTYGFHRGTPVRSGERIVFQVLYGLTEFKGSTSKTDTIQEVWKL